MNILLSRLAAVAFGLALGACGAQSTTRGGSTRDLLARFAPGAPHPGERAAANDSSYTFSRGMGYTFRVAQPRLGFSEGVIRADVGETEDEAGRNRTTRTVMLVSDSVQSATAARAQVEASMGQAGREGCATTAAGGDRVLVWQGDGSGVALMVPVAVPARSPASMALLFFEGEWERGAYVRQFRWGSC